MSPPETRHSTIASSEYSKTAEAQEKDLKTNCMKMIEITKEVNKSIKGIKEKTKRSEGNE